MFLFVYVEPGNGTLRGKGLGGHVPLQVMAPENVLDRVDDTGACLARLFTKGGQPSVFLIGRSGNIDLPETAYRFSRQ